MSVKPLKDWPFERLSQQFSFDPSTGELRWAKHYLKTYVGKLAQWFNASDGYFYTRLPGGVIVPTHRILFALYSGIGLDLIFYEIDHKDRNRVRNVKGNLRPATSSANKHNASLSKANTSGYKGVNMHKQTGRWRATICLNKKHKHLGYFDTPEEARDAREAASKLLHGSFASSGVTNAQ